MLMHRTSYSIKWEEHFEWLREVKQPNSALCAIGNKVFKVACDGTTEVRFHKKSKSQGETIIRL